MKKWIALSLLWGGMSLAADVQYLYDMPTLFPKAYVTWAKTVPASAPDWLRTLQGTGTPIRDVMVEGRTMKFATICKPHFCGDNIAGVLFNPQGDHIGGLVSIEGSDYMLIGQMSAIESNCMERFIDSDRITKCSAANR